MEQGDIKMYNMHKDMWHVISLTWSAVISTNTINATIVEPASNVFVNVVGKGRFQKKSHDHHKKISIFLCLDFLFTSYVR